MEHDHPLAARLRAQLVQWLIGNTVGPDGMPGFFQAFCEQLIAAGLPVWRATLGPRDPAPGGERVQLIWKDGTLVREQRARAGVLTSPSYLSSPTYIVDETGRPSAAGWRSRAPAACPCSRSSWPRAAPTTCMLPLPFLDTTRTAVTSFATRAPDGFSDDDMQALDEASRLFSPYAERALLRRIAIDLLAAYLGPAAGRRVYDGRVERGDVETLKAAIWFCDLRGFTALSEHLPRRDVIGLLNRWFDAVGGAVEEAAARS